MNVIKGCLGTLLTVCALASTCAYAADSQAVSQAGSEAPKKSVKTVSSKNSYLKGTNQLLKNDNLIPTQNRTQAMAIEAQTGHLPGNEDAMLAGKRKPVVKKPVRSDTRVRHRGRSLSHWQIEKEILNAARTR
jgi:hypothetical protein